jgi:hypothetical protein
VPISHSEAESHPRIDRRYRCQCCHVEVFVDPETKQLTPVPTTREPFRYDSDDLA